ncbi:MAG: hypothetical protein ACK5JF_05025 [Oscillospiraceae bacterium]
MENTNKVRIAVPAKASEILKQMGYDIGHKTIRRWAKEGKIPAVRTGRVTLINIDGTIQFLQTGEGPLQKDEERNS